MKEHQARFIADMIAEHDLKDILELGFFHGKSSAYIAATLEDLGRGHLTTIDTKEAQRKKPDIHQVVGELGLAHRVTPIFANRSYTWELGKMLQREERPQFDFCYLDGGHTWDATGFGFVLVDMLLRPGGWIVFDDLNWTITGSIGDRPLSDFPRYKDYDQEERDAQGVRMAFELLGPQLGYVNRREALKLRWGVAQKPRVCRGEVA